MENRTNKPLFLELNTGVRAILVHTLNDHAKRFYEYYGFTASPIHPMTLMPGLPDNIR